FFELSNRRQRVKSPVEFAVGMIRALEILNPTVQAAALADACGRMGQSLYAPPSVAGWDGGPAWINSTAMLARANLVFGLLSDQNESFGQRFDARDLAGKYRVEGGEKVAQFFLDLLVQDALEPKTRKAILEAASAKGFSDDRAAREVLRLILTSPEYQLA